MAFTNTWAYIQGLSESAPEQECVRADLVQILLLAYTHDYTEGHHALSKLQNISRQHCTWL